MKNRLTCLPLAALWLVCAGAGAPSESGGEAAKPALEGPTPEQSVSRHGITIGGRRIDYTATAGTLILRGDDDKPTAAVGYVAYTSGAPEAGTDHGKRPLTFAYNGGPGSSSVSLHMGALGPRRIVTTEAAATPPPPYRVVDNAYSLLDKTDLVMIDPVGTGLSRAVGEAKDKDFWGVDPDIESISRFILQYVSDNGRWNSPKYLLGESYGTTRSAGVVDWLQTSGHMAFNGVVLISVALDFATLDESPGNDRVYVFSLPSFAAAAAYHRALPYPPAQLEPFLAEVRKFALGDYATALLMGDALAAAQRDAVAAKLHEYTGLAVEYIKKANLRVRGGQFAQELLRGRHATLGQLDARFIGVTSDPLAEDAEDDPLMSAVGPAFAAAFLDYFHGELKFGQGKSYRIHGHVNPWPWTHRLPSGGEIKVPNTAPDLAHALAYNPNLRVLVLGGIYDLVTPFLAAESTIDHLGLPPELRSHIESKTYPAGHMMYLHEPSLRSFKGDIAAFIDGTSHP
jgi:carboxypeptidase C (cathepsin A)